MDQDEHPTRHRKADTATPMIRASGAMGVHMRSLDWTNTPFGVPASWPQSLRSAASICLNSRFPIAIYWGPQLALLYNDAWSPIPGEKHPWAFGRPGREVWPEIWAEIGPLFDTVQQTGEGVWQQDQLLPMHRYGYTEECYFNFTFSPIHGEDGTVAGIFNAVVETTFRVIEERRARVLRDLSERISDAKFAPEACVFAAGVLDAAMTDVPFGLFYEREQGTPHFRLTATSGTALPAWLCPPTLDSADSGSPWPVEAVIQATPHVVLDQLSERFGVSLPSGIWPEAVEQAVLVPLMSGQAAEPVGFMVLGVSPRRALDDAYHTFIKQVATQTASAIGNALVFEAEHQRAAKLAEIDRAKTVFFSNVSHEFRTPLTLMVGPLEDVLRQTNEPLPAAAREQIEVAHRNSLRLLKLVNTLLDFSRIEAGRVDAAYEPVDLARFTAELASVFRSAIERAGLQLHVSCPPLGERVYVDREAWEKIVFNLLSNAFKFTFEGQIEVTLRQVATMVELSVCDTGTGIPAKELPHLFERFHRVQGAHGRTFEGSGIGLALVHELVKVHGGAIQVDSALGRGSTFVVSIPLGTAHLPADRIGVARNRVSTTVQGGAYLEEALRWLPESEAQRSELRPATVDVEHTQLSDNQALTLNVSQSLPAEPRPLVLLADDNADMRDYINRLLAHEYTVVAVADGAAALEAVRAQAFDLVVSDVMMPQRDGFELLAALRADPRTRTIPVILLSARADEAARLDGLHAGADDYLTKPFSANELLARVSARLEIARIRREAETKLRASEESLQLAISANRTVAWEWLPRADLITVSAGFAAIYGLPALANAAEGFALVWPDDKQAHQAKVQAIAMAGGDYISEFRITRPDTGRMVWLEERARAFLDVEGLVERVVGVTVDITKRKQAEQRLSHLQKVTASFAETQTLDQVRRVVLGDVLDALGFEAGALRQRTAEGLVLDTADIGNMIAEETVQRFALVPLAARHPAAEAARSGKAVFLPDAQAIIQRYPELADSVLENHIQSSTHLPLISREKVFGVLSMNSSEPRAWDEAEQAFALALAARAAVAYERALLFEAERRAREQTERLQALTAALSGAATSNEVYEAVQRQIIGVLGGEQAGTHGARAVTVFISAGETLVRTGRVGVETRLSAQYRQFSLTAPIPAAEAVRRNTPIWIKSKADYLRQYPGLAHDINQLDTEAAVSLPVTIEGRVLGSMNITFVEPQVFDTSERSFLIALATLVAQALERSRLLEAERTATEREQGLRVKAEEASRLKDEFLATISHELRTPLTSILGYAQLLQARPRDEAYIARTVQKMLRSAKVQAQLIEDLLDVSRIVSGKLRLDMQRINLITVIEAAIDTVGPAREAKELQIEVDLDPVASIIVGDANRLQQVAWNLLANAVKFTPAGNTIRVRLQRQDQAAQLLVSDTGRGISTQFLPFVFDRFRQADSTSTRAYGGLGLGLAIVRHLVELHGGTVEAASAGENQGATFTVNLPLAGTGSESEQESESSTANDLVASEPSELRGLRILLVDDQSEIRELVYDILSSGGAIIKLCGTAAEALEALQVWQPDVLISDIAMPEHDGYWLIRNLRALSPECGGLTPAIALTAYVRTEDRMRVLAAGFQQYAPKPVHADELRAIVASLMREASEQ